MWHHRWSRTTRQCWSPKSPPKFLRKNMGGENPMDGKIPEIPRKTAQNPKKNNPIFAGQKGHPKALAIPGGAGWKASIWASFGTSTSRRRQKAPRQSALSDKKIALDDTIRCWKMLKISYLWVHHLNLLFLMHQWRKPRVGSWSPVIDWCPSK